MALVKTSISQQFHTVKINNFFNNFHQKNHFCQFVACVMQVEEKVVLEQI